MTPQSSMPMGNPRSSTSGNPNNLYNSISSQGMPEQENSLEQSQETKEESPAESVITEFKQTFDAVNALITKPEFQMASKEADLVKRALQNWLETVVTAVSVPAGQTQQLAGGESQMQPQMGATPPQ